MPRITGRPLERPGPSPIAPDVLPASQAPPTVLQPRCEGFSGAARYPRALTPAKKTTGFVPEMNYVGLTPHNKMQAHIQQFSAELMQMAEAYPDVVVMARTLAKNFIKERTGKDLDPDKTYFLRFNEAFSGSKAHSGWRHAQDPYQSMTLTHLFMHRFTTRDELSSSSLDQMSGIYEVAKADLFDESNEVPVLPSVLMKALWTIDFSGVYQNKVDAFWATYSNSFRAKTKGSLLIDLVAAQNSGQLSRRDFASFSELLNPTDSAAVQLGTRQLLETELTPPSALHIYPFNILGYEATDILLIVVPNGGQILYIPGAIPAIISIATSEVLYQWIEKTLEELPSQKALLAHFPARVMDEGLREAFQKILRGGFPTVQTLNDTGEYTVVKYKTAARITKDIASALRDRIRGRMNDDAQFYLRSNGEVSRQQWIDSLSDFAHIGGALAPLSPLIALPVIGAELAGIGFNVDKAVSGDTAAERHAGVVDAAAGAVDVLFNLPLLASPRTQAGAILGTAAAAGNTEGGAKLSSAGGALTEILLEESPPEENTSALEDHSIPKPVSASSPAAPPISGVPAELLPFALPFKMNERFGVTDPSRVLFNQSDGRHYLQVLGQTFQVRYDPSIGAWVIINPKNPHAFFGSRPVRLNTNNHWEVTPTAALRGGAPLATKPVVSSILDGVTIIAPHAGEFVQAYEIIFEGRPLAVKYHAPSNTWRTADGTAYRRDPTSGTAMQVASPQSDAIVGNADMNKALRSLGLQVEYPLELPALDTSTFQDIPRRISSVWLGKRLPLAHMKNLESNAVIASKGKRPFKTLLYLSINDPAERRIALRELAFTAPHVRVLNLEKAAFFTNFKRSPGYAQYLVATQSRGGNLSSASDLLRYPMMDAEGGLYMDVDDTLKPVIPGGKSFGDREFKAAPDGLMLNEPVNHEVLGMRSDFNSSNFGTLPNNSLLRAVSRRIDERFKANPTFYDSRPYKGSDTAEKMSAYAHTLNEMTGPEVLNTVIGEQMPSYRQFSGLLRIAHGELYLEPAELYRITALVIKRQPAYAALGDVIEVNSTSSWLENR